MTIFSFGNEFGNSRHAISNVLIMEKTELQRTVNTKSKTGNFGVWWHKANPGPLKNIPYINQFGSMRFTKVQMDENMKPHLNDGIEIHYVTSGKYDWVVERNNIELLPDDLSITAPWHWNGSPTGKMVIGHFNWLIIKPLEFSPDKQLNLGSWTKLSKSFQKSLGKLIADEHNVVLHKAKDFRKYFEALNAELSTQKEGYTIMVGNIVENLLIDLHRHLSLRSQKIEEDDNFISQLIQKVMDDLNKKWIIEDLAHHFGMGKTKFTYKVKRLTGYPPNSFIINLKIEKAIKLITEANGMSLTNIAYTCGFSSLQHFTSSFTQRTGMCPSKFNDYEFT